MTLKDVLEEICAEEYALPENAPRHRFTLKHRRAMRGILYHDNLPKTRIPLKRRAVIIALVVVLAVITGAASIIRYGGFRFVKDRIEGYDYFMMFAENAENCPKTIEKICYNENMPEKYKVLDELCHDYDDSVIKFYYDSETAVGSNGGHPYVRVRQETKSSFENPVQPEQDKVSSIEIKGYNGIWVKHSIDLDEGEFIFNTVIWDCGEYIHIVDGTVSKEELLAVIDGMTELT